MFLHRQLNRHRLATAAVLVALVSMILSTVPLHACCCAVLSADAELQTPLPTSADIAETASAEPACAHCAQHSGNENEAACELSPHHGGNCCDFKCDCCRLPAPQVTTVSVRESSLADVAVFAVPIDTVEVPSKAGRTSNAEAMEPNSLLSALQRRAVLCCWLN